MTTVLKIRDIKKLNYKYITVSYEGMLQQLVNYVSNGYQYFFSMEFSQKHMENIEKIDEKIINKYQTFLSKDKRYYNKKKGLANFVYLRFKNQAFVLMATNDFQNKNTKSNVLIDDHFYHFEDKQNPLLFNVSEHLSFRLRTVTEAKNIKKTIKIKEGKKTKKQIQKIKKDASKKTTKITVFLTKEMYRNKKYYCMELLNKRLYKQSINEFNKLNGLPAWSGVIEQKLALKSELMKYIKANAKNIGMNIKNKQEQKDFRIKFINDCYDAMYINMTRKPVKIFDDDSNTN